MLKTGLYNQEGKELKKLELDKEIFDGSVNQDCIYRAIKFYQANKRSGTAATKTRGEIRGGGKKPWAQKGTGRARHGSIRSPLWRGGGVVFGPHPREFNESLPKKIRRIALISSLNSKINTNHVIVLEKIELDTHKTKQAAEIFKKLKLNNSSVLVILDKLNEKIVRSMKNIPGVSVVEPAMLNANVVLSHKNIILTEDSLKVLYKFIKK